MHHRCTVLLDRLGRAGPSPDYLIYLGKLLDNLSDPRLVTVSLTALVTLSCHRECSEYLVKQRGMRPYFEQLASSYPDFAQYANMCIENFRRYGLYISSQFCAVFSQRHFISVYRIYDNVSTI
jgi:hypothetical protein